MEHLTNDEILKFAVESGILDLHTIQMQIEMNERKKYLEQHIYKIWQGKNGKWYTELPCENERGRKLVKRTTEKDVQDVIIRYYKDAEDRHCFGDVYKEWIEDKAKYGEIQEQTHTRYEGVYKRHIKDSKFDKTPIGQISEIYLEEFIKDNICRYNLKRKGWSNLRTLLRGTFKYAKRRGYTDLSITQFLGDLELSNKIFVPTTHNDEDNVFTQSEVDKIVDYINNNDDRASIITDLAILLTFQTGMRAGEIVALQYADVNMQEQYINVNKREVRYQGADGKYVREVKDGTKTDAGERQVIIFQDAIDIIKRLRRENPFGEYMFEINGVRIRANSLSKRLKNICEYVNIKPRSLHKIRKTYATRLINNRVDEKVIMRQLGHTDISTTKQYYYYNDKSQEEMRLQLKRAMN